MKEQNQELDRTPLDKGPKKDVLARAKRAFNGST